jgi:hypothetical protein
MNWFWLNMPLAAAFVGAWVGIPMWLVFRHPDRGPAAPPVNALAERHQTTSAGPADLVAPYCSERPGRRSRRAA